MGAKQSKITKELSLESSTITVLQPAMNRPLPLPKSREDVRAEAKRARLVINLDSDNESGENRNRGSPLKKPRIETSGPELNRVIQKVYDKLRNNQNTILPRVNAANGLLRSDTNSEQPQQQQQELVPQRDSIKAIEEMKIEKETSLRKKKLFGSITSTDLVRVEVPRIDPEGHSSTSWLFEDCNNDEDLFIYEDSDPKVDQRKITPHVHVATPTKRKEMVKLTPMAKPIGRPPEFINRPVQGKGLVSNSSLIFPKQKEFMEKQQRRGVGKSRRLREEAIAAKQRREQEVDQMAIFPRLTPSFLESDAIADQLKQQSRLFTPEASSSQNVNSGEGPDESFSISLPMSKLETKNRLPPVIQLQATENVPVGSIETELPDKGQHKERLKMGEMPEVDAGSTVVDELLDIVEKHCKYRDSGAAGRGPERSLASIQPSAAVSDAFVIEHDPVLTPSVHGNTQATAVLHLSEPPSSGEPGEVPTTSSEGGYDLTEGHKSPSQFQKQSREEKPGFGTSNKEESITGNKAPLVDTGDEEVQAEVKERITESKPTLSLAARTEVGNSMKKSDQYFDPRKRPVVIPKATSPVGDQKIKENNSQNESLEARMIPEAVADVVRRDACKPSQPPRAANKTGTPAALAISEQCNAMSSHVEVSGSRTNAMGKTVAVATGKDPLVASEAVYKGRPRPASSCAWFQIPPILSASISKLTAKFDDNERVVVEWHEMAKHRQRDLGFLKRALTYTARLSCSVGYTDIMRKEVEELISFSDFILDEAQGGYFRRRRIMDIADLMKKRHQVQKFTEPEPACLQSALLELAGSDRLHRIEQEIHYANDQVQKFGDLRRQNTDCRRSSRGKRKTYERVQPSQNQKEAHRNRSGNEAAAQLAIEKKRLELENFKAAQKKLGQEKQSASKMLECQPLSIANELPSARMRDSGTTSASEESEEEDGAEYNARWTSSHAATAAIKTPGTSVSSSVHYGDALECRSYPIDKAANVHVGEQTIQDLLHDIRAGRAPSAPGPQPSSAIDRSQAWPEHHAPITTKQNPDAELLRQMQYRCFLGRFSTANDAENMGEGIAEDFDDEYFDIFEYLAKGEFFNIEGAPDDVVLVAGTYLDMDDAERKVREVVMSVQTSFRDRRNLQILSEWHEGLFSQSITFDGGSGCRAFVERRVVAASKYKRMKQKQAFYPRIVYAVRWERVTRHPPQDELFDDDTDDIEEPTYDEVKVYTTSILANRQAKQMMHDWYAEYLPGPENSGYLGQLNTRLESYLEDLENDHELFQFEDSFKKDGVTEMMKLWVEEVLPLGPRN